LDGFALYVNLLLDYGFYEKAEETLSQSIWDSSSDMNVFHLFHQLYSRTGNIQKLEQLLSNGEAGDNLHNQSVFPLSYNAQYFSSQTFDFVVDLISIYSNQNRDLRRAYLQAKAGMMAESVYYLRKFSDQLEDTAGKYLIRAELSLIKGNYEKSKGMFKRLSQDPKFTFLSYNRLGDISNALGDSATAKQYYKTAFEIKPDHFDTLMDMIKTSILEKDYKTAKRHYNQAKEEFGEEKVISLRPLLVKGNTLSRTGGVKGLVWSEITGNILPIEILVNASPVFELNCGGNIGFAMRDSIETVMSVLKNSELEKKMSTSSIKINIPYANTFKDGPSAGLALVIGCWSEVEGIGGLDDFAFTGELSLSGNVLPVGGIPEKVFGAYMNGVSTVFLPAANHYDLRTVSSKIKENLEFRFVTHYQEAVEVLWNH
jgi:ATP-dependent Lon protease